MNMSAMSSYINLSTMSTSNKGRLLIVCVVGGAFCLTQQGMNQLMKIARDRQMRIYRGAYRNFRLPQNKAAFDLIFLKRLYCILKICFPTKICKETLLICVQMCLLCLRTMMTIKITRMEGECAMLISSQDYRNFFKTLLKFVGIAIPASILNSGIKFIQSELKISIQRRLTTYLHLKYCKKNAYYASSILKGITQNDKRLTDDIHSFSDSITELFNHTFKPLLDVIIYTSALSSSMGYKSVACIYGYFALASLLIKASSPPLSRMENEESALTGAFRHAHQRLGNNAQQIAFYGEAGGLCEKMILNDHLENLLRFSFLSSFQNFLHNINSGFVLKYFVSIVSLFMYALPVYLTSKTKKRTQSSIIQEYVRSMQLLKNATTSIADLVSIYKGVTKVANHTTRVSELLEEVEGLQEQADAILHETDNSIGFYIEGDTIIFHNVCLDTPKGIPLVDKLTFEVSAGKSLLLMGDNGVGKTTVLKALANLWPLKAGTITRPSDDDIFFLSQDPYILSGTLKDQVIYPDPPPRIWQKCSSADKKDYFNTKKRHPKPISDEFIVELLSEVGLDHLLARDKGLDGEYEWDTILSGGEKQRLAIARAIYRMPKYVVLDEATSNINEDGEEVLYTAMKKYSLTFLSVGHKESLKKYHQNVLVLKRENDTVRWYLTPSSAGRSD